MTRRQVSASSERRRRARSGRREMTRMASLKTMMTSMGEVAAASAERQRPMTRKRNRQSRRSGGSWRGKGGRMTNTSRPRSWSSRNQRMKERRRPRLWMPRRLPRMAISPMRTWRMEMRMRTWLLDNHGSGNSSGLLRTRTMMMRTKVLETQKTRQVLLWRLWKIVRDKTKFSTIFSAYLAVGFGKHSTGVVEP